MLIVSCVAAVRAERVVYVSGDGGRPGGPMLCVATCGEQPGRKVEGRP